MFKVSARARVLISGVVAGFLLSALSLGVAVPASYADTLTDDLRSYQLRAPTSLTDNLTLTPGEKTAYRDLTRNRPGKPLTVPLSNKGSYSRPGGGAGISALFGVLISVGAASGWFEVKENPETKTYVKGETAKRCEQLAKAHSGSPDWFQPPWLADANEWLFTLLGAEPCTDKLQVDESYEPITQASVPLGVQSYPFTVRNTTSSGTNTYSALTPYWSSASTRISGRCNGVVCTIDRQEGWIIPFKFTGPDNVRTVVANINPDGTSSKTCGEGKCGLSGTLQSSNGINNFLTKNPSPDCVSNGYQCAVISKLGYDYERDPHLPQSLHVGGWWPKDFLVEPLPYVDPALGSAPGVFTHSGDLPLQEFTTTITDTQGNVYSCKSASFRETEAFVPKPCSPTIPDWAIPDREEVTQGAPGAPPAELVPIRQTETSPEYQDWRTKYPGCDVQTCLLDLTLDGRSCFDQGEACADWSNDPNKATKYQCNYNGVALLLAKCAVYEPTFTPAQRDRGYAYKEESGATPGAGTSSTPGTTVAPFSDPNPEKQGECFPRGWAAFNPISWVLQPIGCALNAAFVPRDSFVVSTNQRVETAVNGSAVGALFTSLEVIAQAVPTGGGCSGIPWKFQVYSLRVDTSLLNSCAGSPLATTANIIRGILSASLSTIAVLAWVRYIGMIFGYGSFGGGGGPSFSGIQTVREVNGGFMSSQQALTSHQRAIGSSSTKSIEQ